VLTDLYYQLLGIRPTYEMQNISESFDRIILKLSGFLASAVWDSRAKNYENCRCQFWGRVRKIFLTTIFPPIFDVGSWKFMSR